MAKLERFNPGLGVGILGGAFYAVLVRIILGLHLRFSENGVLVVSIAFLFLAPLAAGYITVDWSERRKPGSVARWICAPWLSVLLCMVVVTLSFIEGTICVVMILPIALLMSSVGGVAAGLVARRRRGKGSQTAALCLALLPLMVAPIEANMTLPREIRHVETEIRIRATPETVWRNIARVPHIGRSEMPATWTEKIGFPRPVEATLSFDGVGGVRHASFERGLLFLETITDWQPNRKLRFSIRADTAHIPPTTLDEHLTIGGRYFDVLDGEYEIEPLPSDGGVILHLRSEERLSTDFNWYAAPWADSVMRNIQQNILTVIRRRCEAN